MYYVNIVRIFTVLSIAVASAGECAAQKASDLPKTQLLKDNSIRIECGEIHSICGLAMWKLREAVQKYPKATQFKVSWFIVIGGTSCNTSVRYIRNSHRLYIYLDGGHVDAGPIQSYEQYSNVTDDILIKLAEKHKPEVDMGGNVYGFFDDISNFGCKRSILHYPGAGQ